MVVPKGTGPQENLCFIEIFALVVFKLMTAHLYASCIVITGRSSPVVGKKPVRSPLHIDQVGMWEGSIVQNDLILAAEYRPR